jgi:flagellar hook-associated protein 1 FlgK
MSASPLLSIGMRAMAANYAALQTVGHNISNANVAGYSRQQVELATAQGQFTGAGFFGRGVNVATVVRAHDAFLTGEASRASSLASSDGVRLQKLSQLETVFKTGEAGLGFSVSSFLNSMADLANQPGDGATRQVVLTRAAEMSARFSEAGQALDDIQAGVDSDLRASVATINSLARSIATANEKIAELRGLGQTPNDLLDERDRLISRLSEEVQVTRIEADDGTVGVFIAGGQRLVLGTEAAQLAVRPDQNDPRRVSVGLVAGPRVNVIEPSLLGGGKVAGLLRFQNTDLTDGRNLIGRMAAEVGLAVNQQQQRGVNLMGSDPTPALFRLSTPQALPNANNARDANGAPLGAVQLSYTGEAGALRASEYDLREDSSNPGGWVITRLVGGQLSLDPADRHAFNGTSTTFQGINIDFSAAPPQAGDTYRLQTVGRAANDMATLLRDPRDLAAASPLTAAAPATNTGTMAVGPLRMTTSPLPFPGGSETLSFTRLVPPVGGFEYSVTSSLTGGSNLWNPGEPLIGGNGYELQVSGSPGDGDTLTIDPTPPGALASNNGNATAMLGLRDLGLIDGNTVSDGYALALAEIGSRVQASESTASISAAVAASAEAQRSSQAGVSLDEEAARLIQYQQSYQAAAKMLQVAQSLFDTLLQTAGN